MTSGSRRSSGACGENGESGEIGGSSEQREIVGDAKSSANTGAPAAVFSPHHVSELALDLGPDAAIALFPSRIALRYSAPVERVVFRMCSDGASAG